MKNFFVKNWAKMSAILIISFTISYGVSDYIDLLKAFCVITPVLSILLHLFNKTPEEISKAEELVSDLDKIIGEQTQVIEEYEQIFDSQLVELPCVCGGNTFQGLFSPKTENIVECEKCKNKYRVTISYDSVMISEPLNIDQTFDQLVGKSV
jgi:hypothetical protein